MNKWLKSIVIAACLLVAPTVSAQPDPQFNSYLLKNRGQATGPIRFFNRANGSEPSVAGAGWTIYSTTDSTLRLYTGVSWVSVLTVGGGGIAFDLITSGTNTTAAMLVGTGASLAATGTGTIEATTLTSIGANTIDLGADLVGLTIEANAGQTAHLLDFDASGGATTLAYVLSQGSAYFPQVGTGDAQQFAATIAGTLIPGHFAVADDTTTPQLDVVIQRHTGAVADTSGLLQFLKSRGTNATATVVITGDQLGQIDAGGHDGTDYVSSAAILFEAVGTIGDNRVPSQMRFFTSTDAAPSVPTEALSISEAQVVAFANQPIGIAGLLPSGSDNYLLSSDGASGAVAEAALQFAAGVLAVGTTGATLGAVTLAGSTSGVVTIQPAAAAGTWTLTLPTDDGTAGQVLQTDGAGVTSWAAAGGLPVGGDNYVLTSDGASAAIAEAALQFDGTDLYLGPPTAALSIDRMFRATSGVGTNIGTGDLTIRAGLPTGDATAGAAKVGRILFRTTDGVNLGAAVEHAATTILTLGTADVGTAPTVDSDVETLIHASDSATNSITNRLTLRHISSGTVIAGFGVSQKFVLEENDGNERTAAIMEVGWTDAGAVANADAYIDFKVMENDAAAASVLKIDPAGTYDVSVTGSIYSSGGLFTLGAVNGAAATFTGNVIMTNTGATISVINSAGTAGGIDISVGDASAVGGNIGIEFNSDLKSFAQTSGTPVMTSIDCTFAPTSGTATFGVLRITPVINQTGGANGAITGILYNATETALVGSHTLLSLQVASAPKFSVSNAGAVTVAGSINPDTDGTLNLGTQTTAQWANVWSDLINGSDYSYINGWRSLEAEKYAGYPVGWAIGHTGFETGKVTKTMPAETKPVFVVTDEFIEYHGRRITPAMLDRLIVVAEGACHE